MSSALAIQLAEAGADPERLDDLTIQLREELLALDVDDVERVQGGEAPAGSRSIELAAVGALLVTLKESTDVVASVVNTIREWLRRDPEPARTVRVTIGDRTIELSAASSQQQDRLVAEFVRARAGGKDVR
jgi:Flp pilus assembly CpaE family ATPase